MGHPRKAKKSYSKPKVRCEKSRIEEEIKITREFGFKNKKEIWKLDGMLRGFKGQAKKLSALNTEQSKKETDQLFARLQRYGLLTADVSYDAVLGMTLKDLISRRLQTVLVDRKLARTPKQARQFIVHGHVMIGDKKITSPSHMVTVADEQHLGFHGKSSLSNEEHPERAMRKEEEEIKAEMAEIKSDGVETKAPVKEAKAKTTKEVKQ